MRFLQAIPILGLLLLAGCHTSQNRTPPDICHPSEVKSNVYALTRAHYLWNTEIPSSVIPEGYADASQLLDALTVQARREGKDRNFSFITTRQELTAIFDEGVTVGFGFNLIAQGDRVFVAQVYPGSGAAAAGFIRGDEVLAMAETKAGLDAAANQITAVVLSGSANAILNGSRPQTTRYFRVRRAGLAAPLDLGATSSPHSLDPVPGADAPIILEAGTGHKVGYLMLRTFIAPAADLLRKVMGQFRQAGVTDLIVDFRYNGGGRLDVSAVLLDLLRAHHGPGDVMYQFKFNPSQSAHDQKVLFAPEGNAMAPGRIAFIMGARSASASESVVNALLPYYGTSLALVGQRSFGKPVGQSSFASPACDWVLMLVNFEVLNATGDGRYFNGLPDAGFNGVSMAAVDDLSHAPGDPAEACTAAALEWIATGATGAGPIGGARMASKSLHPLASTAQSHLPGLF